MPQQLSPFTEVLYGWPYGSSGWNTGMDDNLLKFSFLFDKNIDSIVDALPAPINGQAHYLTADNRIYFAVGTTYYSTPVPKHFILTLRSTGQAYQFNGTSLVQIDTPTQLDSRLDSIEVTVSSLGTAAYVNIEDLATQAELDIASAQAAAYTDTLRSDLSADAGSSLVGFKQNGTGAVGRTAQDKMREAVSVKDFGAVGDGVTDDTIAIQNAIDYVYGQGGGVVNLPAGIFIATLNLKSNVTLRGCGDDVTIIKKLGGANVIQAIGSIGDAVALTADALAGSSVLTITSTSGLSAGDWLVICDTATYSTDASAAGYTSGESIDILSVDSSTQLTLSRPLYGPMKTTGDAYTVANGSNIRKVSPITDIRIVDITATGLGTSNDTMVYLKWVRNAEVKAGASSFGGAGISLHGTRDSIVSGKVSDGTDNIASGLAGYGVSVVGPCDNIRVESVEARRVRHAFTTIGGPDGFPHNIYVHDNCATDTSHTSFDTHEAGWNIFFWDNLSVCSKDGGYYTRSPYTYFYNNTANGHLGSGFGLAGDNIYAIAIENNRVFGGSRGITGTTTGADISVTSNRLVDCGLYGIAINVYDPTTLEVSKNRIVRFGRGANNQVGIYIKSLGVQSGAIIRDNEIVPFSGFRAESAIRLVSMTAEGCLGNTASGSYSIKAMDIGDLNFSHNGYISRPNSLYTSIADDSVYSFTIGGGYNLIAQMGSASAGAGEPNLIFRFRANSSPMIGAMTTIPASVVLQTGALTGTTGADGNFTISVTNGVLYLENRTGATKNVWLSVEGPMV